MELGHWRNKDLQATKTKQALALSALQAAEVWAIQGMYSRAHTTLRLFCPISWSLWWLKIISDAGLMCIYERLSLALDWRNVITLLRVLFLFNQQLVLLSHFRIMLSNSGQPSQTMHVLSKQRQRLAIPSQFRQKRSLQSLMCRGFRLSNKGLRGNFGCMNEPWPQSTKNIIFMHSSLPFLSQLHRLCPFAPRTHSKNLLFPHMLRASMPPLFPCSTIESCRRLQASAPPLLRLQAPRPSVETPCWNTRSCRVRR